jgi:SNF2-related domain/SNF2 Helicase protein/Helicase conserved C-terminal domain
MLALHVLWSTEEQGSLLVWAEDGELPATCPPQRGRRPAVPRPRPHPFAAPAEHIADALASCGASGAGAAAAGGDDDHAVVWLPGRPDAPGPSSQLVRTADEPPAPAGKAELWPFSVPVLRCPPSAALDVLLSTAGAGAAGLHVGASVVALAAVAELALEVVAGGRVLPDLATDGRGSYVARWRWLGAATDAGRLGLLAAALPPVCRALEPPASPRAPSRKGPFEGNDPAAIVGSAMAAFVDALCRDGVRRPIAPVPRGRGPRSPSGRRPAVEAWLAALGSPSPEVTADAGDLAKLERLVAEWRAGAAGHRGPWRLCFRLKEPEADGGDLGSVDAADGIDEGAGSLGEGPWRVDLLLQATDDLSLLVEATEVWRSGDTLRRATRTLDAPHEVLLTELGRAVRAYPELAEVLREPAPTGVETDLAGAHRFLAETAPALEVAGFGVLLPAWWRRAPARLGVRLHATSASGSSGSGLLSQEGLAAFDWEAALGDETIGLTELRRLAALKAPLVRVRGQWVELRPGEVERLVEFLARGRRNRMAMTVPDVLRAAAGQVPAELGVPIVGVEADGVLGAMLRGELEDAVQAHGTPAGFRGALRPYQERGVAWIELLERIGLGACLADDMGLGKTATVLAVLAGEREVENGSAGRRKGGRKGGRSAGPATGVGPTLVVCPTSVVGNWQREAERFTPELLVVVHHGATRAKGDDVAAQVAGADLVITSYPLVERDRAALAQVPWRRVVLDEAQHVKNPGAKQTRAVRSLRAPRRLALTGTPVENHLGELWSIMEILNPGLLGSESSFREHFAVPIERYREEDAAERLRTLTRPFVLRRLKTDRSVIADLPDKLEMKVVCSLTREQATLYQAVVDEMLRRIAETEGIERKGLVLATMLRLKQVCNHPAQYLGDGSALGGRSGKLERTVEILEEVREVGERALVFTQFAEMGALLRDHLQQRLGCRVSFLHGGVPRARRDEMVAELQAGDGDVPVMVLSLKAGGTGLNLTAANHVVHFDRWWNPAVENQATDRAFRIGQRRNVQVRKLVCAGTVEDRIDQMIEDKRALADRIVGTGEGWLTELSTDELADVFRLSADTVGAR